MQIKNRLKGRKDIRLAPSQIIGFKKYSGDDSFALLYRYALAEGFYISDVYTRAIRRSPHLDKLYWKSMRPMLPAFSKRRGGMVKGDDVIHHAIHYAFSQKYCPKLKGFPRSTLLAECVASAADLYFVSAYFHQNRLSHPYVSHYIEFFKTGCRRARVPFTNSFNRMIKDPWKSYQVAVVDMFEILEFLMKVSLGEGPNPYQLVDDFETLVARIPYYGFIASYDLHGFISYAHFHCGEKSTAKDVQNVRRCLALVKKASSMHEFLRELLGSEDSL